MNTITAEKEAGLQIAPQHDFFQKLCHSSVISQMQAYVAWRRGEGERPSLSPVSINLDLTTACNYYCGHCVDLEVLNSGKNFTEEELFASLAHLITAGLRSVILIGGGEPTVHPHFTRVVEFLKSRNVQVAIVSNGSRTERVREIAHLLEGRDWVRFSLDSGTDETFQRMHRPRKPISLGEICAGAERIRGDNPDLSIGFSFVIVWDQKPWMKKAMVEKDAVVNVREMVTAAELARESGFSYISFKPFLNRFPDGGEVMNPSAMENVEQTRTLIQESLARARELQTDSFRVLESTNLRVLLEDRWRELTRQPCVCHMQAFRHVVSPLGIFNCPAKRGVSQAQLGPKNGYASPEGIRALQQSVVAHLDGFDARTECAHITCLYNPTNWAIEHAIQTGDPLVEVPGEQDLFL